ncbi:helix-turn-helix transcriptional regulator [Paenibacillus riograndensis]|uniref:HTH araC/xylS-type domain-containing protein n=1 Tax=Paenibacillus riograndensis SBR5 TaxID=1073571 RepID=A0A0E4HAL5_9BACL|nr:AraC family transcriptional regulator [Paenibacillus riograndensis]CQR55927.1 hypothetical protein PRIO_3524 [Paenibacillus riograndensis SBR5]
MLINLVRELQQAGDSRAAYGQFHLFDEISRLKTVSEIEDCLMERVIAPMASAFHEKLESQNKNISERMMEIIHKEYDVELTLDVCASRLNYHPNYLKTVFRKEAGVNFSEYVSNYRLGIAKRWLLETDMKISDIAIPLLI